MKALVFFVLTLLFSNLVRANVNLINGTPVQSTEAPWVVKIEFDGRLWCTGSLISLKWILTAGHCFDVSQDVKRYKVYGGGSGLLADLLQIGKVNKILVHPDFVDNKATPRYDIALIKLDQAVESGPTLSPISILTAEGANSLKNTSASVSIYGWGYLDSAQRTVPKGLAKIEIPLLPSGQLNSIRSLSLFGAYPKWADPYFFFTYNRNQTTCYGDSGAGWTFKIREEPFLIAIHSGGDACRSVAIGNPAGSHAEWLQATIAKEQGAQ